jgi:hypothetical protein
MRFDQRPERLCLSGSGLPRPDEGSSDRSISLSNLQSALCSRLSFSRMLSYASQVLPSNINDLIHLLFSWLVAFSTGMGFKRAGDLLHKVFALEYVKRFLLSLPVIGAHYNKGFASPASHFERLVPANHLFYKTFQVISEFVYADCVHRVTFSYGNTVQLYAESPDKAKPATAFRLHYKAARVRIF